MTEGKRQISLRRKFHSLAPQPEGPVLVAISLILECRDTQFRALENDLSCHEGS